MTIKTEDVESLMKRLQRGVGGRDALNQAHDIMAECYGTLGALVQERDRLKAAASVENYAGGMSGEFHATKESGAGMPNEAAQPEEQGRPVKPHRSGGGMPAEPIALPPLPNYVAKGNLGVCYYDAMQMHQYAMKYADMRQGHK